MNNRTTSQSIDDYEIGAALGRGTVGEIYRAERKSDGLPVAIKILLESVSSDKLIRSRFRREMDVLARISHPNIIGYFGGGDRDGRLFLVMEYVDGGTIRELLDRDSQIHWREVASVGRQVASALQLAHNNGIVHRDIKPANLFLTRQGVVKLGDFGIARDTHQTDLTAQGLTVGTHAYMPPEQINGSRLITGSADLYSLGCTLYEMLIGRVPFEATSFQQLFQQHLSEAPLPILDLAPTTPIGLSEVIEQLMQKKPEQRPFNARAVQAAMMQVLEEASALDTVNRHAKSLKFDGKDQSANELVDVGQSQLAGRITGMQQARTESWRAVIVLVAIVIVIAIATFILTSPA